MVFFGILLLRFVNTATAHSFQKNFFYIVQGGGTFLAEI
jgi:hypothetical protein